ncbi:MAG: penicillin-binding protein [Pseudomonadota bacterium]
MPQFQSGGDESKRRVALRLFAIGAFFALAYGILMSRAIYFHLKQNTEIEKVAMRQYRTAIKKSTRRGKILDSKGRELAINVPTESVYADPRFIKNPKLAAAKLSAILGLDKDKLYKLFSSKRKFVWIKRSVESKLAQKVHKENISGVAIMNENGRSYPNSKLASSVLGMVGIDAIGLAGLEYQYNNTLLVDTSRNHYSKDARGHIYLSPASAEENLSATHLKLTLDERIQYIAEKELSQVVERSKAKAGVIIVLDPQTGDVLAMANVPSFDPNSYADYPKETWRNIAISDTYEPGSTFKAVVISSALDKGVVKQNDIFDCRDGALKVRNVVIKDAHSHGRLSVADIIKVSSNVGSAQVQAKVGRQEIYQAIRDFGFGELTGIELPGEAKGILSDPKNWSDMQFVTIAFGHGVSATPLQMAVAFAAIANGGEVLKPHVVKEIIDEEGKIIYQRKKQVRSIALSKAAADLMKQMLQRVVEEDGTGVLAASSDYPVAGKTGTAQKVNPKGGYLKNKYFSSFIGFAPVEQPRVVVYVGLDEPKGYYYGGQVAAPVFRNVVEEVLKYLNEPIQHQVVQVKAELNADMLAEGQVFSQQAAQEIVQENNNIVSMDNQVKAVGKNMWQIPNFSGLTMKAVFEASGQADLNFSFVGSGLAVSQRPAAGSVVPSGTKCIVEFRKML